MEKSKYPKSEIPDYDTTYQTSSSYEKAKRLKTEKKDKKEAERLKKPTTKLLNNLLKKEEEKKEALEKLLIELGEKEKKALKKFFIEVRNIDIYKKNNPKSGFLIKKDWDGMAINIKDENAVVEIERKYNNLRKKIKLGILFNIDDELKRDEYKIEEDEDEGLVAQKIKNDVDEKTKKIDEMMTEMERNEQQPTNDQLEMYEKLKINPVIVGYEKEPEELTEEDGQKLKEAVTEMSTRINENPVVFGDEEKPTQIQENLEENEVDKTDEEQIKKEKAIEELKKEIERLITERDEKIEAVRAKYRKA